MSVVRRRLLFAGACVGALCLLVGLAAEITATAQTIIGGSTALGYASFTTGSSATASLAVDLTLYFTCARRSCLVAKLADN